MIIYPLTTVEQLQLLEPLLSQSYGEAIIFQDETDYFLAVQPSNWYYALNSQQEVIGFIRHFPVGELELVQLECYAADTTTIYILLKYFIQQWSSSQALRLLLNEADSLSIGQAQQLGFQLSKTYYKYRYNEIPTIRDWTRVAFIVQPDQLLLKSLQELIAHDFGNVSTSQLQQQIIDEQLVVVTHGKQLIGCCITSAHEVEKEIIQLIIHPSYRRQGYGRILLEQTLFLYYQKQGIQQFRLSVRQDNQAAIQLYEQVGFVQTGIEYWLNYIPTHHK